MHSFLTALQPRDTQMMTQEVITMATRLHVSKPINTIGTKCYIFHRKFKTVRLCR